MATVLPPGEVHDGVADERSGLAYAAVSVPPDLVATVFGSARTPVFDGLPHPPRHVRRLVAAARSDSPEEHREWTLAALSSVFADVDADAPRRPERHLAAAAKRLLDESFLEPICVAAVAERMGVAPATLIRGFRRHNGVSPYAYVVSRRVDFARQLLDVGVWPAEAACRAGFYDQAHLNRHFARLVGVTPGVYRRG